MERLTSDLVEAAAFRLSRHYPNSGITEDGLVDIIEDWHMDFNQCRISPEMFARMVILARRRCKFFPVIAEMLDFYREISEMDRRNKNTVLSLPEPEISEDQLRINKAILTKAMSLFGSGLTPEDSEKEMADFIEDVKSGKV